MNVVISTMAIMMKQSHAILRIGMSLVGRLEVPEHRLSTILRCALTVSLHITNVELRLGVSLAAAP